MRIDKPEGFKQAQELVKSGDLRHLLKLQLILIAFGEHSTISLRAILELLQMPEDEIEDWTDGLDDSGLLKAEKYLKQMIAKLMKDFGSEAVDE